MKAEKIITSALKKNPDIQLVLDIAARARDAESRELPVSIGMATEIVSVPVSSACLASSGTPPAYLIQIALL